MRDRRVIEQAVSVYRLGLYDPDPDIEGVQWIGRKLKATPSNMRDMESAVREFNRLADRDPSVLRCLGIFPVGA